MTDGGDQQEYTNKVALTSIYAMISNPESGLTKTHTERLLLSTVSDVTKFQQISVVVWVELLTEHKHHNHNTATFCYTELSHRLTSVSEH